MFINVYHCDPKHGPFALDAGLPMDNAAIKTSPHNNVHKVLFIVTVSSRYNTKMQSSIAIINIIIRFSVLVPATTRKSRLRCNAGLTTTEKKTIGHIK